MPTYVYRCAACGEQFEVSQSITDHDASKPNCPKCGSGDVSQAPTAFIAQTAKKS